GPVAPRATAVPMRHARLQHEWPAFSMFSVQVGIEKPPPARGKLSTARPKCCRTLRSVARTALPLWRRFVSALACTGLVSDSRRVPAMAMVRGFGSRCRFTLGTRGQACLVVVLAACAPTKSPENAVRITTSAVAPQGETIEPLAHWATVDAATIPVRVRLPWGSKWERSDTKSSLQLALPSEQIHISIRLWPSAKLTNVDQCYSELRLQEPALATLQQLLPAVFTGVQPAPPLEAPRVELSEKVGPEPRESPLLVQAFEPEADFHGQLRVLVGLTRTEEVTGGVVAVAAGIRRCLALVASTSSTGTQASAQVGDRLAWIVDGVAKSLRIRTPEDRLLAPAIDR
ncbi:MAG TPA: hypothetical protein VKP30_15510, partial [Polyangiaceae bacterium]|nr:hypothetical protein [Polyangiaceae bacterium]